MSALALSLIIAACGGRIPSALASDAPTEAAPTMVTVTDLASAASALVGDDPLLRRPRVTAEWTALDGGEPIAAWAALARTTGTTGIDWWALERRYPGTLAVPLARGARLAALESMVVGEIKPDQQVAIAGWLAPLGDLDHQGPADVLQPLAWLAPLPRSAAAGGAPPLSAAILRVAERQVLLGWLDGPRIPVAAAAEAMVPGVHDRLIDSPAGALLLAASRSPRSAVESATGLRDLQIATGLALADAAADSDQEQARATRALADDAATLVAEGEVLSEGRDAALRRRLRRATRRLSADAGAERSVGFALVAIAAERLIDACPDRPCSGLDRVGSLDAPSRWSPDTEGLAASWRVIAAKRVLDTVEVTVDRPTWRRSTPALVDLLLGSGAESVDISILRQPSPGPETWLALTRAVGTAAATDPDSGIAALRHLLVSLCDEALSYPLEADHRALIERIRRRAASPPPPRSPAPPGPPRRTPAPGGGAPP